MFDHQQEHKRAAAAMPCSYTYSTVIAAVTYSTCRLKQKHDNIQSTAAAGNVYRPVSTGSWVDSHIMVTRLAWMAHRLLSSIKRTCGTTPSPTEADIMKVCHTIRCMKLLQPQERKCSGTPPSGCCSCSLDQQGSCRSQSNASLVRCLGSRLW